MSNLISTSSIASGSIIYPEHVLRSIQALRGETDTLFILSGSLVVSASDVRYPSLLYNPTPSAFIAYNTSSGNFYWTTNPNSISPSAYVATGSISGNTLTFTKGDNTTFDLVVSTTASSATSLITASISSTTLTFTKGDNSTFNVNIVSSSYALNATSASQAISSSYATNASSSLYALTASYALNGGGGAAFPYTGSAEISGSLKVSNEQPFQVTSVDIASDYASQLRFYLGGSQNASIFSSNPGQLTLSSNDTRISNATIQGVVTGSLLGTASNATSASYAVTASYALNAGIPTGVPKTYQIVLNMTGGSIDVGGTPIASVLGPNGENKTTLEGLGWSFSTPTSTRLTVGRPSSSRIQPLISIMTHGNNAGSVYTRVPSATSTTGFAAMQTLSGVNYTTLDVTSINNTNTGCASSGATTVVVTFGLIS
jgi:hypothetical protein